MSFQNHPAISQYQAKLADLKARGYNTEEQTRAAFSRLLEDLCSASERNLKFVLEKRVGSRLNRKIDGAVEDGYSALGYWEAKDAKDKLEDEIQKKIALEYPTSNTIFEDTQHAILYQHAKFAGKFDLSKREEIGELLDRFFGYTEADAKGFAEAVKQFLLKIPELSQGIAQRIEDERNNEQFKMAFDSFFLTCQLALNPQIKESAVKEMLVQHLLTERLFKKVFDNEKWFQDNIIAREIDYVIDALSSGPWNRSGLLKKLDPFFNRIEDRARDLPDYHAKQEFLNSVYEQFLQAYSPDTADTMGIVYTPQEIVDWMCQSVETVLRNEFGQSLATPGVQILDPCTGTGNFLVNVMRRIADPSPTALVSKYKNDLHANELMLLPYYVASGNIEHEYFDLCGSHVPFKGLCFQDTLDLTDSAQTALFAEENSARVARQKAAEITVIIGNPPYNVGQKNENDNNKNRVYKGLKNEKGVDDLIKASYAKSSRATLQNKLYDPYVRFFKWASERLKGRDGVICFVSNNSFVDQHAFDGMRAELGLEFNHIWHLDLHGNVRRNPKLSGTTHNVFGIQVGVGITILVKNKKSSERFIKYHRAPEFATRAEKLKSLANAKDLEGIAWQDLTPNAKNAWLTEGLEADFETLVPLGSKEAKAGFSADAKTIFKTYSTGVNTGRDTTVFSFNRNSLVEQIKDFATSYNTELERWIINGKSKNVDDFVDYARLKWSRNLKRDLQMGKRMVFLDENIKVALHRPFSKRFFYHADIAVDELGITPRLFPTKDTKNRVITLSNVAHRAPFMALMTDSVSTYSINQIDGFQCFPLYTFSADGSERIDNISPFALLTARAAYGESVTREDVFYACYALLHHPAYRAKYGENLKRELPRLPLGNDALTPDSWTQLVEIGRKLGDLHVGYESATPFAFQTQNTTPEGVPYSFRVEKMSWKEGKTKLKVNDSILLGGFTPEMFAYKLGNRSALDWIVESYRVKSDARSGLTSDPNREDEPNFVLDLVGKVGELPVLFG